MNSKSFFVVFLQVIQSALTALTVIILANMLPPGDYGRYVSSITFASVLPLFAGLGSEHVFLMQASRRSQLIPVLFGNAFFIRSTLTVFCILLAALVVFIFDVPHASALVMIIAGALLAVFANPFFLSFYRVKGLHVRPWILCFFSPFLFIVYLFIVPKERLTFEAVSFGYLISNTVTFLLFMADMYKRIRMRFSWSYTKRHFKTGIMFSVSQAFDYAFARMDIFVIQFVLGTYSVAIYAAGQKIVSLFQLIPSSFHIVELPEFHRVANIKPKLIKKFRDLRRLLFELSFLFFGLLILNAQFIVDILYKGKYLSSSYVVVVLSLANIVFFINYPYYMLAEAIYKIKERMIMRIVAFACTIIFLWLLLSFYGVIGAAFGLLMGQVLFVGLLHLLTKSHNAGLSGLISDGRSFFVALLAFGVAYFSTAPMGNGIYHFFLSSFLYTVVYLMVGMRFGFIDASYLREVLERVIPSFKFMKGNAKLTPHYMNEMLTDPNSESNDTDKVRDIVFLITGKPLPAMLDMARVAQNSGFNSLMIILERGEEDLIIDSALVNFDVIVINVKYKGVDFKRLMSIPSTYKQIRDIIFNQLKDDGIIVTSSYDLLLFGRLIASGRDYVIRHQVRDLHSLQLSKSLQSLLFVFIEKHLLSSVESIIVSSPGFVNGYYKRIYKGRSILLENTPAKSTWQEFRKDKNAGDPFVIGFVGIIRYKPSLYQLITAAESLHTEGYNIKVLFAGGGNVADLKERITFPEIFEFRGSYEYTRDIKKLYSTLDLIYAVYDSNDPNCQLAMPNKFYESIISRIPIIVASKTLLSQEVDRHGIGTHVVSGDAKSLIDKLRSAVLGESWYRDATARLAEADADHYFESYDIAMKESILPANRKD